MSPTGRPSLGIPSDIKRERNKKLNAERQKRYRDSKKAASVAALTKIAEQLPVKLLTIKCVHDDHLGCTTKDYGSHLLTLNFEKKPTKHLSGNKEMEETYSMPLPDTKTKDIRHGSFTMGMMYDNDQKVKYYGRERCIKSGENLEWLKLIATEVGKVTQHSMQTMRVNSICGARTQGHTDTLRGLTNNQFIMHQPGMMLVLDKFPAYRVSLVKYQGSLFIPHCFCTNDGLVMIAPNLEGTAPTYYVFRPEVMFDLEPVGVLNVVIMGIKQQLLQILPKLGNEGPEIIKSPTDLPLITWDMAIKDFTPQPQIPKVRFKFMSEANKVYSFNAWMHRHWVVGNADCVRTSVFHRFLRESPTASFTRDGQSKNYIDRR